MAVEILLQNNIINFISFSLNLLLIEILNMSNLSYDEGFTSDRWMNVQEPIKDLFTILTKAIRVQSNNIEDLDSRINQNDDTNKQLINNLENLVTTNEFQHYLQELSKKSNQNDVDRLESRLNQVRNSIYSLQFILIILFQTIDKISSFTEIIQLQSITIKSLQDRCQSVEQSFDLYKSTNSDKLISYIDQKLSVVMTEIDRKLDLKANQREIDFLLPKRIEDLYQNLNTNVIHLKNDILLKATKEDFHSLQNSKVKIYI